MNVCLTYTYNSIYKRIAYQVMSTLLQNNDQMFKWIETDIASEVYRGKTALIHVIG